MSLRPSKVDVVKNQQNKSLQFVLTVGSTEMKRSLSYEDESDGDMGTPIDWSKTARFKVETYGNSKINSYSCFIASDKKNHLEAVVKAFKVAFENSLHITDYNYRAIVSPIENVEIGRGYKFRLSIEYVSDREPVDFGEFKGQIDTENLASELIRIAKMENYGSNTIVLNEVHDRNTANAVKFAKVRELDYGSDKILIEIEGRITI